MKAPLSCLGAIAAAPVAALLVACASPAPQQSGRWIDPALGASSRILRTEKVFVACEAWDLMLRQNCEASLFQQLQARGVTSVMPVSGVSSPSGPDRVRQLVAEAASAGARTTLIVTLTPIVTGSGFSGASIALGGFSWGRSSGAGIGLSAPIGGGGWGSMSFAAEGRVTDVPSGRPLWNVSFVASPSADLATQIPGLTSAMLDSAQSAGLL